MSKELRNLVKKIQFLKSMTVEQVAKSVGYSRVHIQREMKKQETSDLEGLLKEKHKDVLQSVSSDGQKTATHTLQPGGLKVTLEDYVEEIRQQKLFLQALLLNKMDKLDSIESNLATVAGKAEGLQFDLISGRNTVLKALARLEKKPELTLLNESDKLKADLAKHLHEVSRKAEVGK